MAETAEPPRSRSTAAAADGAAPALSSPTRNFRVDPPRVLPPFTAEQAERRRVTLTQARGEIRLLNNESLSISAVAQGDTLNH